MEFATGHLLIVVLPLISKVTGMSREPKLTNNKLVQIKQYVESIISPFVIVSVQNPVYEEVLIRFNVRFFKGYDEKYNIVKLNKELKELLSPWLFSDSVQLSFTREIRSSSVLYFIETRDYVDFVTNFAMYHLINGKIINHSVARDTNAVLKPRTPVSVFITYDDHFIKGVGSSANEESDGIGGTMINTDFILHDDSVSDYRDFPGIGKNAIGVDFGIYSESINIFDTGNYSLRIFPPKSVISNKKL